MNVRDEDPQLAALGDMLRAQGFDVKLRHYKHNDGREVGVMPDSTGTVSQDWTHGSLLETAAYYARGRK